MIPRSILQRPRNIIRYDGENGKDFRISPHDAPAKRRETPVETKDSCESFQNAATVQEVCRHSHGKLQVR